MDLEKNQLLKMGGCSSAEVTVGTVQQQGATEEPDKRTDTTTTGKGLYMY